MTQKGCVFCAMADGKISTDKLYDDGVFFAVRDINPVAPVHLLIIPYAHVGALSLASIQSLESMSGVLKIAPGLAREIGVSEKGYRLIVNQGSDAGQTVPHFHMHLLAGRSLGALG